MLSSWRVCALKLPPEDTPHTEETGVETLMKDFLKLFCHETIKLLNEKKPIMGHHKTGSTVHTHTPPASDVC